MKAKGELVGGLVGLISCSFLIQSTAKYVFSSDPIIHRVIAGVTAGFGILLLNLTTLALILEWWDENDYGKRLREWWKLRKKKTASVTPASGSTMSVSYSGVPYFFVTPITTPHTEEESLDSKVDKILKKVERIEKIVMFKRPCKECIFDHVQWEKNLFEFIQICIHCPRRKGSEGNG